MLPLGLAVYPVLVKLDVEDVRDAEQSKDVGQVSVRGPLHAQHGSKSMTAAADEGKTSLAME